jgi:anaerobic selenocysteine-containing dehydrogenase
MAKHGVSELLGIPWDFSHYQPLPQWRSIPLHDPQTGYDMYCINYKPILTSATDNTNNPWLMSAIEEDPYLLNIMIHPAAAKKRGIQDGDSIWVESREGRIEGCARLTQGVQLETVAIGGAFGRWTNHPVERGKGTSYNELLTIDEAYTDKVSSVTEISPRVRVYKKEISP